MCSIRHHTPVSTDGVRPLDVGHLPQWTNGTATCFREDVFFLGGRSVHTGFSLADCMHAHECESERRERRESERVEKGEGEGTENGQASLRLLSDGQACIIVLPILLPCSFSFSSQQLASCPCMCQGRPVKSETEPVHRFRCIDICPFRVDLQFRTPPLIDSRMARRHPCGYMYICNS